MKYLKFFKHRVVNYDYIIKVLTSKDYGWGNVIVNEIKEFENEEGLPNGDDDYIVRFNHWLYKKFKNTRTTFRDDLVVKRPKNWYSQRT
jgi:hypothetical protein